jgi:hypothetical protein
VRAKAFDVSRGAAEPYLDPRSSRFTWAIARRSRSSWRHVSKRRARRDPRAHRRDRITAGDRRDARRGAPARRAAYSEGEHARTMIPAIKQTIGLTTRQERAVARYRASLDDGKRPADRVDRMVARTARSS